MEDGNLRSPAVGGSALPWCGDGSGRPLDRLETVGLAIVAVLAAAAEAQVMETGRGDVTGLPGSGGRSLGRQFLEPGRAQGGVVGAAAEAE